MCDCGTKRQDFTGQQEGISAKARVEAHGSLPDILFMYIGQTGVTVLGQESGKTYRFRWPGDRQPIDYRDAPGMSAVPVLRRV